MFYLWRLWFSFLDVELDLRFYVVWIRSFVFVGKVILGLFMGFFGWDV